MSKSKFHSGLKKTLIVILSIALIFAVFYLATTTDKVTTLLKNKIEKIVEEKETSNETTDSLLDYIDGDVTGEEITAAVIAAYKQGGIDEDRAR